MKVCVLRSLAVENPGVPALRKRESIAPTPMYLSMHIHTAVSGLMFFEKVVENEESYIPAMKPMMATFHHR